MTKRSRAVLFGAVAILVLAAMPASAGVNDEHLPFIEPVDWLPAWYFATWAVLDTSRPTPRLSPGIPIDIADPQPQGSFSAGNAQGRGGGVGTGALAGAAGVQAALAFPARLGRLPTQPTAEGLRHDLVAVRRALGY